MSGGLLYFCYACSSLFLAKNVLHQLKARRAVLFGMVCLLTYVTTFLVALAFPDVKWIVCIIGSITGGVGAGIMWTAQGSYYTLNSSLYLMALSRSTATATKFVQDINSDEEDESNSYNNDKDDHDYNKSTILNKFAAYFAAIYLCSEAVCKLLVTGLFLLFSSGGFGSDDSDNDEDDNAAGDIGSWQVIAFFVFTFVAWTATGCSFYILDLSTIKSDHEVEMDTTCAIKKNELSTECLTPSKSDTVCSQSTNSSCFSEGETNAAVNGKSGPHSTLAVSFCNDFLAVFAFIRDQESFRYLLPYQFAFGFSSTYMGFLVYGIILNDNGKEGYIGLLSALSVMFAGGLTIPVAMFTNRIGSRAVDEGSMTNVHIVMLTGAAIFMVCSVFPLFLSDETIASWPIIVPLVCIYGAGRSIWENSNKALIASLFTPSARLQEGGAVEDIFRLSISSVNECADEDKTPLENCHERAFAAIYFTSGVGAAIGFFTFKFLSSPTIAASTVGVGLLALCSNHYFFTYCHGK